MATAYGTVIAGASAAGVSAAKELRRAGYAAPVTLLTSDPDPPYRRPPLSKELLAAGGDEAGVRLRIDAELGLTVVHGATAAGLDLDGRAVTCADGTTYGFDQLVIATGASPVHPWRDAAPPGVHVLRTLADARALKAALAGATRVAVIGAGFIGAEVAAAARTLGRTVTLIDTLPAPHAPVLGPEIGAVCADLHRAHGTELRLGARVTGITGDAHVTGVRLAGGETVAADLVVVGVGVRPETGWLDGSGVALDDGVVCDATCAVRGTGGGPLDGVAAAGDVARWPHPGSAAPVRIEHWDNAVAQGRAAARTLLGDPRPYAPTPYFWSDQYTAKIQVVGLPGADDDVAIAEGDTAAHRFVAVYSSAGRVTAALSMNLPQRLGTYRRVVQAAGEMSEEKR
ncbi:MAG TPA: FAD-dependent oxidoreductase [Streptosporangiaceae bacterium]